MITQFLADNGPYIKIALAVLLGVVISFIEYGLHRYYLPRLEKTDKRWQRIFLNALHGPLQTYLWLIVVSWVLHILVDLFKFDGGFANFIGPARIVLTMLVLLWFVFRLINSWEAQYATHVKTKGRKKVLRDVTSVYAVAQVLRVLAIIFIVLMLLSSLGISISALLTFGGVGALAFSLAAKDTLANFLGGLMIYWDRPFVVGDWIRSPDREIEGTVLNIGWRLTKIHTFDKRPLYVPNGVFSNISIENPSRMTNRRIKTLVGVRYQDATKVNAIVDDIKQMIEKHPDLDTSQVWFVNLVEFAASSLNIQIYTFTKTTDWVQFQSIQQDVFNKTIDIITDHGAEVAFPTRTLYLNKDTEDESRD